MSRRTLLCSSMPLVLALGAQLGCSARNAPPVPRVPTDREQILAVVLDFFEHKIVRPVPISTFLVTDGLDRLTRDAASRLRPVITRADIPVSNPYVTPPGHLVLSRLALDVDSATVEAGIGPVAKSKPGEPSLDCGDGFTLFMSRNAAGHWQIDRHTVVVC